MSCNNDDTPNGEEILYLLKSYTPSAMLPETEFFEPSDIMWSFNFEAQTIAVIVSDDIEPVVLDQGAYTFNLVDHACSFDDNMQLVINGFEYGILIREVPDTSELMITDACLDGHVLVFDKALIP